ncbi:CBO0543 family protein [Paenibacillus oryzisoli]|uniref:CBO0543 family protein n=1 Tax=Paenibacillus oryzisoli TaxID=1850517 RepID=UPI003D2D808B
MFEVIGVSGWLLAGWLWGDWRHWRKYESTILYMILLDILYYYITCDHRLWSLMPQAPFKTELLAILGEFTVFASAMLMFLGRFPKSLKKGSLWTLFWIVLFIVNEWVLYLTGTFRYSNGWTIFDSTIFCLVMFPMLKLHAAKPLLAYGLTIPFTFAYIYFYHVPVQ